MKMKKLLLSIALLIPGCASINKDLTHVSPYKEMIGTVYTTPTDMVIYRYKGEKTIQIGKVGSTQGLPESSEMHYKFPWRYFDTHLLGMLPQGSKLKLIQVREEGSFEMTFIYYYMQIVKSGNTEWIGKVVSPQDLDALK